MDGKISSTKPQTNPYVQRLRIKKPSTNIDELPKKTPEQKTKNKRKKHNNHKPCKKSTKTKSIGSGYIATAAIDMTLYKKIFSDHFEGCEFKENDDTFINSQKSFETFYHHVLNINENPNKQREIDRFSNYLKGKKEAEQVTFLDRSSKIFHALGELLNTDASMIANVDPHKIIARVDDIKLKLDQCKRVLQKCDMIPHTTETKNFKPKCETAELLTNPTAFTFRLQLYEQLKAQASNNLESSMIEALQNIQLKTKSSSELTFEGSCMNNETEVGMEELNTNDTSSEKANSEKERCCTKEIEKTDLPLLFGEIDKLFNDDDMMFNILECLDEAQIQLLFKPNLDVLSEVDPLFKDFKKEAECGEKVSDGWEFFKQFVQRKDQESLQLERRQMHDAFKLGPQPEFKKKHIVKRVSKACVNALAKIRERTVEKPQRIADTTTPIASKTLSVNLLQTTSKKLIAKPIQCSVQNTVPEPMMTFDLLNSGIGSTTEYLNKQYVKLGIKFQNSENFLPMHATIPPSFEGKQRYKAPHSLFNANLLSTQPKELVNDRMFAINGIQIPSRLQIKSSGSKPVTSRRRSSKAGTTTKPSQKGNNKVHELIAQEIPNLHSQSQTQAQLQRQAQLLSQSQQDGYSQLQQPQIQMPKPQHLRQQPQPCDFSKLFSNSKESLTLGEQFNAPLFTKTFSMHNDSLSQSRGTSDVFSDQYNMEHKQQMINYQHQQQQNWTQPQQVQLNYQNIQENFINLHTNNHKTSDMLQSSADIMHTTLNPVYIDTLKYNNPSVASVRSHLSYAVPKYNNNQTYGYSNSTYQIPPHNMIQNNPYNASTIQLNKSSIPQEGSRWVDPQEFYQYQQQQQQNYQTQEWLLSQQRASYNPTNNYNNNNGISENCASMPLANMESINLEKLQNMQAANGQWYSSSGGYSQAQDLNSHARNFIPHNNFYNMGSATIYAPTDDNLLSSMLQANNHQQTQRYYKPVFDTSSNKMNQYIPPRNFSMNSINSLDQRSVQMPEQRLEHINQNTLANQFSQSM